MIVEAETFNSFRQINSSKEQIDASSSESIQIPKDLAICVGIDINSGIDLAVFNVAPTYQKRIEKIIQNNVTMYFLRESSTVKMIA